MIVAGVMSGTSADGIDVALVEMAAADQSGRRKKRATKSGTSGPSLQFLGHAELPYPADVRRLVLASMNSPRASVADLARLNFLLGDLYAEAVLAAQKRLDELRSTASQGPHRAVAASPPARAARNPSRRCDRPPSSLLPGRG